MDHRVTIHAQGNQVRLNVGTCLAAELLMMDLKIRHRSAELTSPAVAAQNLLPQQFVRDGIQSGRFSIESELTHAACPSISARKLCFCVGERNRKNRLAEKRSVSGSP